MAIYDQEKSFLTQQSLNIQMIAESFSRVIWKALIPNASVTALEFGTTFKDHISFV